MKTALIVILVLVIIMFIAYVAFVVKKHMIHGSVPIDENGAEITYEISTLYGEVEDIVMDSTNGLSRITVVDTKGKVVYGFSKLSVKELEMLYTGKGNIEIPVLVKKTVLPSTSSKPYAGSKRRRT